MNKYILIASLVLIFSCRKPPIICVTHAVPIKINLGSAIDIDASCTTGEDMVFWRLTNNVTKEILLQTRDHRFIFTPLSKGQYSLTLIASKNSKVAKDKPVASSETTFPIDVI